MTVRQTANNKLVDTDSRSAARAVAIQAYYKNQECLTKSVQLPIRKHDSVKYVTDLLPHRLNGHTMCKLNN